jgi:hypothetical protein
MTLILLPSSAGRDTGSDEGNGASDSSEVALRYSDSGADHTRWRKRPNVATLGGIPGDRLRNVLFPEPVQSSASFPRPAPLPTVS